MPRMSYRRAVLGVALLAAAAVPAAMAMPASKGGSHRAAPSLSTQVLAARMATAKYATNLKLAEKNGYGIITRQVMNMGWHFMNPAIKGFNVKRPQLLVYERRGHTWQLGAVEWVFPKTPASPPLPGATYGSFPAACHYDDGSFIPAASQDACAPTSPDTGAAFFFWHPLLVTMHVWLWYPNPDGLYSSTNAFVHPFTRHGDLIDGGSTGTMKGMANMPGMSH